MAGHRIGKRRRYKSERSSGNTDAGNRTYMAWFRISYVKIYVRRVEKKPSIEEQKLRRITWLSGSSKIFNISRMLDSVCLNNQPLIYIIARVFMQKFFMFFLLVFIFFSGCAASGTGALKKNFAGGEAILASLFDSGSWAPEIKSISVVFSNKESVSLSRKSRNEISAFVSEVLLYEDYEIGCEFIFFAGSFPDKENLLEKRSENIKRFLIKNGIDKDKIYMKGYSVFGDAKAPGACEAFIEAEVW
jgi:hypothetical protein